MEFTWKDGGLNFLPEQGAFGSTGPVEVRDTGDGLEISGKGWKRTVKLVEGALTIEQLNPLPPDGLTAVKRGNVAFTVERPSASTAIYRLN